ncbi:deoxyribose-phosphate aldolase [Flavobacteriaceae bacterium LYZ1037]|nr:deoxyribose-phosphate aldolase [Flavobacteriaceae bacterium LYZ1037]
MNKFVFLIICIGFSILSCKNQKTTVLNANEIINKSIDVSGGETFDASTIAFNFRDKHYIAKRNNGIFQLVRQYKDSIFNVKDVVSNDGFKRYIEDELKKVPDSMAVKYAASVNSVHYFSVLPYGLNDAAVMKTGLGEETIKDQNYYKIQVTFKQEGGGEDFEDVFVYWVNKDTYKVDYLAYSYKETDGVGFRFREAYNERYVNGLRFVDYNNYNVVTDITSVTELGVLFETNKLKLLSKIELKNISVN